MIFPIFVISLVQFFWTKSPAQALFKLQMGYLPEINGIEAAKQIRQVSPSSKIIFVTQHNDPDIRQAALETGAEGYVLKMNARQELPQTVRAAIDAKQASALELP